MKKSIQNILAQLARKILKRHHPLVIGITGSVGKTSAKQAIFCVVSQKFKTRRSEKNFNNEYGLPFTIIGVKSPGKNPFLWLGVVLKGLWLALAGRGYPEVLVLEMGIDRPGDMDYLTSVAKPDIAVITNIGLSHYEFFNDQEALEKEKGKLAESLSNEGTLVVNADNAGALRQKSKVSGKTLSYGFSKNADVKITNVREDFQKLAATLTFVAEKNLTVTIKAVGAGHALAAASAVAVAQSLKIENDLIQKGLEEYRPEAGRLNIIAGIKKTLIIDDSYNSAPDSVRLSLQLLAQFPQDTKIAILGDMLELGAISDSAHLELGTYVAALNLQKLITIGSSGKLIADGALQAGMNPNKILSFDKSINSLDAIQNLLTPGEILLIKGSQGMRMEKITKEIMAEPMKANELLCRQDGKWLNN